MTKSNKVTEAAVDWHRASKITPGVFHVEKESGDKAIIVLSLNESCTISSVCGGVREDISPKVGAVTVLPPGSRYSQTISGIASALIYEIPWLSFEKWIGEEPFIPAGRAALKYRLCIRDDVLAKGLFSLAAAKRESCAEEESMHLVLGRILHSHSNTPVIDKNNRVSGGLTPRQLRRVKNFVDDQIGSSLSLEQLSDLVGLSKFHFIKAFKGSVGKTPHQYVISRRVDRACESLLNSRVDANHIAAEFGFSNVSHLSMMMVRRFGVGPGNFRRLVFPQSMCCPSEER